MKAGIGMLLALGILISCSQGKQETKSADGGWDVTVAGKVGFPQKGDSIHIYEITPEGPKDKQVIKLNDDYTFSHLVHLKQPGYYNLDFYGLQIVTLMLNKSNVEVSVDGNNRQGFSEVKGSPEYDLIKRVQDIQVQMQQSESIQKITMLFNQAQEKNDMTTMQSLQAVYMDSLKKNNDRIAAILLAQPASIATINLLGNGNLLNAEEYANVYKDAAEKLKLAYPDASFAAGFIEMVDKMSALAIGSVAPEIALPNPEGNITKLSSLRGKYVLVDFWAKWCGPCRRENPNVVKAYHRFKDKGFEVFGVSLDRNLTDWVEAIKEDGLVWTQVSDLKSSEAAQLYNVSAIPFSILLDKNGVIIAKNLRGPALEQKLEEVFR